jgi:hypothetical protein
MSLQTMHREVFAVLDFNVGGPTPGAYMSELWTALSTLRSLLIFDGGWNVVQNAAWDVLLDVSDGEPLPMCSIYKTLNELDRTRRPPLSNIHSNCGRVDGWDRRRHDE